MPASSRELKAKHTKKHQSETVLVLQGGGSLGAYECGVFKALAKSGIRLDVVAGTSIGAVNAGIIAGAKSGRPEEDLENFWLDLAEKVTPSFLPDSLRMMMSSYYGAVYGNSSVFSPVWPTPFDMQQSGSVRRVFPTFGWPSHLYDLNSLEKTLKKYVDFSKINGKGGPRLIATATDIQRGQAVVFDSHAEGIDAEHLVACAGFPFYGIAWTEKNGRYLWDGALLSNTPLREVIDASPRRDKTVYIVSLFPRVQKELPANLSDIWHRARDIMFTEKTDQNIRMSKVISSHLLVMTEMHDILAKAGLDGELRARFEEIEPKYQRMAEHRGAIINDVTKIERSESVHFLFEDADFSIATIRNLIRQGEADALAAVAKKADRD
ncbi:patatin-like phospholipase family protein [Candidatus Nitrososphaera sp. FF02]|uniref:patatin-like phospholipase family protein n=1 Tax=Candidatus Nitrososphaera sp. FF02 TaxID=3398226 RepID=UPI0039E8A8E2